MSFSRKQFTEPTARRVGTRARQPNLSLDFEASNLETLRLKKKSRSGHLSTVTAISNEISSLLTDYRNLQEVKEKLLYLDNAFEKFVDAHRDYVGEILDENAINEGQRYLEDKERKVGVFRQQVVDWIIGTEHKRLAESLQVDSVMNPEDSISCAGTPIPSGTSKVSKHSSKASSRGGRTSSVAAARAIEAARIAELKAEISMLEKRRAFEEKKFHLQQEELRLNLETEMVKKIAKERVYAAMTTPSPPELKPLKLETQLQEQDPPATTPRARKSFSGEVHHPGKGVSADCAPCCQFDNQAFIANENMRKETIGLQRQQTALQFQQNRIMELLAHNQNRSKLPQPRVPVFDGNPIEYCTFVRAFESLVESRTLSSTDRLYYLEKLLV